MEAILGSPENLQKNSHRETGPQIKEEQQTIRIINRINFRDIYWSKMGPTLLFLFFSI